MSARQSFKNGLRQGLKVDWFRTGHIMGEIIKGSVWVIAVLAAIGIGVHHLNQGLQP